MIEGLWSIKFIADNFDHGAGVIVFETGRVFGGDSSYYYTGNYSVDNGVVSATITATHYAGPRNNIVGDVDQVTWVLSGDIHPDSFKVRGRARGFSREMVALLTHRSDLP